MPNDNQLRSLDVPGWDNRLSQLDRELAATGSHDVQVLFLGDSIIQGWYPAVFQLFYGHRTALNLGVRAENTRGLLWQLDRIPLTVLRPRLVVLLIGTNNLWPGKQAQDVARGTAEIANQIHRRSPKSRILLPGLLPRGADPADPLRGVQAQVNALIADYADGVSVFCSNPGVLLLDAQGRLPDQISADHLHPSRVGYGVLSAELEPPIRKLLGE